MTTREYDRRWGDRTPVNDPVMIMHGDAAWFSRLKDVSSSGCGIVRPEECELGQGSRVRVFFHCDSGPALMVEGIVMRATPDELGIAYQDQSEAPTDASG